MARQTARNKKKETKKKNRPVMWSDVSGVMRVYGNEFVTGRGSFIKYSTSIGKKNDDSEYDNCYYSVFFPREDNPELEGAFEINIRKGFLTLDVYEKTRGKSTERIVSPAIMVQEYVFVDDEQEDDEDKPF